MLESYIAPLFMGYVNKYIKNLRPEDLSLSFWGGEVVLNNLELNLDVLQQELNLPVTFLSGKIYKLQLHVPWTQLIYEPIVVTIDTMEFIIKLKDIEEGSSTASLSGGRKSSQPEPVSTTKLQSVQSDQYTPGYVQGILNKVVNNVSFRINNIIVKYVEEDLVFSVNIKSVDFYSANGFWEKAFIELSLPELLLRKVCTVTDLTVCLDQRNPSGKIELYQDPILYRCNLICRISSRYPVINSLKVVDYTINVFCENIDLSLTDQQLPMILRLVKLILGLYYGKLDLPGCPDKLHTAPEIIKDSKLKNKISSTALDASFNDSSSWTTWALSMFPGINEVYNDYNQNSNQSVEKNLVIFISTMTATLKKTSQSSKNIISSQRYEFTPVVCVELSGCKLCVKIVDETCFDVQLHVDYVTGYLLRKKCLCQVQNDDDINDDEAVSQDEVFMKFGTIKCNKNPFWCLKESLFSSLLDDNTTAVPENLLSTNASKTCSEKTENEADLEFDADFVDSEHLNTKNDKRDDLAIFFSYYYEMKLPKYDNKDLDNIFLYPDADEILNEVSEKVLMFGQSQIFCSTKFIHLCLWLIDIISVPVPTRKEKTEVFLDPFVLKQLKLGNFLTRKFTITIHSTDIFLLRNDHNGSKQEINNKYENEGLLFSIGICKIVKSDPMYPLELVSLAQSNDLVNFNNSACLSSGITTNVILDHACFCLLNQDFIEICHSTSILFQTIFEINIQKSLLDDQHTVTSVISKTSFSCQNISLLFTKSQLILFSKILSSWFKVTKSDLKDLSDIVFSNDKQGAISIKFEDLIGIYIDTVDVQCFIGSVSKVNAAIENNLHPNFSSLIFEAPCNSLGSSMYKSWFEKSYTDTVSSNFISILIQYDKKTKKTTNTVRLFSLNVSGCCFNFDNSLYTWLQDKGTLPSKRNPTVMYQTSKGLNRSIGTQKRSKSYARIVGDSSASSHKSKDRDLIFNSEIPDAVEGDEFKIPFGDWLALKIDFFKSFHIKLKISSFILLFPEGPLPPASFKNSNSILDVFKAMYASQDSFPSTLVVCLPNLEVASSSLNKDIFANELPILSKSYFQQETLPWTITCTDFAVLTLMKKTENFNNDQIQKYEFYLCNPVSWNLYLAASPSNKADGSLGTFSEGYPREQSSAFMLNKKTYVGRHAVGFVIHMDWSVCELGLSHAQIPFLLKLLSSLLEVSELLSSCPFSSLQVETKESSLLEKGPLQDQCSVSSSSVLDHAEALSTLTCSTVQNSKITNDVSVSLWIQLTLPKIILTTCSRSKEEHLLYYVTSEINELMFSMDYQDNILELTNKIGSFTVYYSLLRFDKIPVEGWTLIDQGYLLFQKEDSLFKDSKAFLSISYKGAYHQLLNLSSPSFSRGEMIKPAVSIFGFSKHPSDFIFKHDISVHVLKFDIICNMKPILSSLLIVKDILVSNLIDKCIKKQAPSVPTDSKPFFKTGSIVPMPVLNIHIDSIRVIVPVGDINEAKYMYIDDKESVFIFRVDSISIDSSPCNPITKTVVCKDAYKKIKKLYREPLKNIKLWNVQYQLDIKNIVFCTTNWHAIEKTFFEDQLGSVQVCGQNPAFEWNCQSEYTNTTLTPICSNLDFKVTLAPPLLLNIATTWITSTGIDIHSPRGIKVFANTAQIRLLLQIINDFNAVSSEVICILTKNLSSSNEVTSCSELVNKDSNSVSVKPYEFPPVELFASVCEVSIMVYLKCSKQPSVFMINPALSINCGQVNCSFTTTNQIKFRLNIHSLKVLTSSNTDGIAGEFPVLSDYDRELFICGNGNIDKQTGLLPDLCSCVIKLNDERKWDIYIDLKKPMYLNFSLQYTENLSRFFTKGSSLFQTNKVFSNKKVNDSHSESLCHINKVNLNTSKLCFSYSPIPKCCTDKIKLECVYQSLETEMCCISNVSLIRSCSGKSQILGIEIYLLKEDLKCSILNPFICDLNVVADFIPHSANDSNLSLLPRISLWINIGPMQLSVNQQLFDILNKFTPQNKEGVISAEVEEKNIFSFDLTESEDDLKNGLFCYSFLSVDEDINEPKENEIFFTHEASCGFPIMMWKYPQPRVITQVSILPVPFHFSSNSKIRCQLEYWNGLKQCYCLYYTFYLSEKDSAVIQICNPESLFFSNYIIATLWRVVVCDGSEADRNHVIPASSLAVCMKVNSVYSSLLIPSLECKTSISLVDILFENSMALLGQTSPTETKPYFFESDSFPENCEVAMVTLTSLNIESVVNKSNIVLDSNLSLSVRIMDFDSFCWVDLMSPSTCSAQMTKSLSKDLSNELKLCICASIGSFNLYITPNAISSLSLLAKGWTDDTSSEVLICSHYLICNDTQDDIHVQQVNTEEELLVHSGQALQYSWYKHKEQLLVLSVASNSSKVWCEPITLKDDTIYLRSISYPTHTIDLLVEIKSMQGIKKQITVRGCFSLVNKMDIDLNVQMISLKADKAVGSYQHKIRNSTERINLVSENIILPANIVRPSITLSVSLIKSLKVAHVCADIETSKEIEFPLDINDCHIGIQLDSKSCLNGWLTVMHDENIPSVYVVTISPLYVFRNHLPDPIQIRCSQKNSVKDFIVAGQGNEKQICNLNLDSSYDLSFCLFRTSTYSQPALNISTSLSKKLKCNSFFADLSFNQNTWPYVNNYNSDNSSSLSLTVNCMPNLLDHQVELCPYKSEIIVQASLYWFHLPTVLIELKPSLLLHNSTLLTIKIDCKGIIYTLTCNETISLFHFCTDIRVGLSPVDEELLWSSNIQVINSMDPDFAQSKKIPESFHQCSIHSSSLCYQFIVSCHHQQGIYVVDIKERFVIHNISKHSLVSVLCMTESLAEEKILDNPVITILPPNSTLPCSILNKEFSANLTTLGLFVNFTLVENIKELSFDSSNAFGNVSKILMSKLKIIASETFCLSKEHLRESLNIKSSWNKMYAFVATSNLEKGVIHIFIDEDTSSIVAITNNCDIDFYLKDLLPTDVNKKGYQVLCSDSNNLISLNKKSVANFQPKGFKVGFPKTNNKIELGCQLATLKESCLELSQPVLLENNSRIKIFVPNYGEVHIHAVVVRSQLCVELNDSDFQFTPLCKSLPLPKFNILFKLVNVIIIDQTESKIQSMISASISEIKFIHNAHKTKSSFKLSIGYIQIDNQLKDFCYHFPVVFLPMRQLDKRYHSPVENAPFPDIEACLDADFFSLTFEINQLNNNVFLDYVRLNIQPCEMYLEDTYIYRLVGSLSRFVPVSKKANLSATVDDPAVMSVLHPLHVCNIEIGELCLLISVHASVKVFLSSDHMPVVLGRFKCFPTQTVYKEFIRTLLYHYATQALVRAGWMLGSLEIIGNPTGLLQNLGRGISNFFVLPYNGLKEGPAAFVSGISQGASSFLTHISMGTLTSINNFASSVSRNMDRLCFDENHLVMQEERRSIKKKNSFKNAFGGFGMSLLGAVAGIVDHPIQNVTNANSTSEVFSGVMLGFAKGIVGVITKPIGGAMELISQASQQILQGAGLVRAPERMFCQEIESLIKYESRMKFLWQILRLESRRNVLIVSNVPILEKKSSCSLILTEAVLFVFDVQSGSMSSAFPIKEIKLSSCKATTNYHCLQVSKKKEENRLHSSSSLDENPNFRQFFQSFRSASASSQVEALCESNGGTAEMTFDVDPGVANLLLVSFQANKNALEETACVVDVMDL